MSHLEFSRSIPQRAVRRSLVIAIGCSWLALGFLSDSVPWFSEPIWILTCGLAAGSAFALAHHTTLFALKRYTIIVAVVGTMRSVSYATHGAFGPMWVWLILIGTTVVAALALWAQPQWFLDD